MDKAVLGLLADILYIKEIIEYDELMAINKIRTPTDINPLIDKMLRGEFNGYRKGNLFKCKKCDGD